MKVSAPARPHPAVPQALVVSKSAPRTENTGGESPGHADFRAVYDAWFGEVARWIRSLGGLPADRDDILQEVFLVVRRRLSSFDGKNVAGWLYRITRRQVRDFRRRAWVTQIFTRRRVDEPDLLPHTGGSPVTALERKEEQRILHAILEKMPDARRSAFVLFEIEGLSGEEIARIQSVPLNTVWTRLHHARKEFFALAAKYRRRMDGPVGRERGHYDREGERGSR
jgi:RNA polymerase sigma-70 factor, ECF subfamily